MEEYVQGILVFFDLEVGDMFYPNEESDIGEVLFTKIDNKKAISHKVGMSINFNPNEIVLFAGRKE